MELFHLFNISSGHRFHVEISLQWKVRQLQETVVQVTGIQIDDQVLLKHSGEVIKCEETICNCCPENAVDAPVYLFQRSGKHDKQDSRMWEQEIKEITSIIDVSMENANQLLQAPDMHEICHDVPHRASECRLAAQNAVQACARIAEEHRLMLQGWVALVNNMDSSVASLRKRASRLLQQMEKVHQGKKEAFDMLRNFDKTIDQLKRIRVPENILSCSHGSAEPSVVSDISLYGWIAASDPEHSLKELVDQVTEQLFQQTNMKSALQNIEKVMEMSKNINCREIKGMNMRLSYLEQHLQYAEDRSKIVEMHTSEILNTSSRVDQFSLEDFTFQYRHYMGQVYDDLKEIRLVCNHFLQSKLELLRIMRTRLDSWIVRVYNRLHHAHNELLMFEEKCTGLKQRLDLLEQVKEAPVMYATAVTEIVRRRTFQREFNSWFSVHVNKCCSLYDEETRIRAEFSTKMEKHFLRVLFHGMFDTIPPFFVKSLPEFDTALSPINDQYLKELRNQNIEELNQYLNVAPPQVFLRLDVRDPLTQAAAVSRSVLPREESSITVSPAFSLPLQSCNFFSTNWLSADDVNDCFSSTTPLMLMTKSQSRAESLASLNVPIPPSLNQLSMPGGEDELILTSASTSITTTAPIAIPVSRRRQTSSRFSTPDNQFHTTDLADERQFVIDDLTIRSHSSYELLKHVTAEIIALSKVLSS